MSSEDGMSDSLGQAPDAPQSLATLVHMFACDIA